MDNVAQYLISRDNGNLQIPYEEYVELMKRAGEAQKIQQVKSDVLANLQRYLEGQSTKSAPAVDRKPQTQQAPADLVKESRPKQLPVEEKAEKVSVEFSPDAPEGRTSVKSQHASSTMRAKPPAEIPPIKKGIEAHYNAHDSSGRLLNVFKQYYTCLNESCGGTVRVTMKDGVCSLWNYDEWEEFAFVDIFEGDLRFAVDPRYTDELSTLNICEVPRLLASRLNLVSIRVGDLNKTMLNVLTKAFGEIGLAKG